MNYYYCTLNDLYLYKRYTETETELTNEGTDFTFYLCLNGTKCSQTIKKVSGKLIIKNYDNWVGVPQFKLLINDELLFHCQTQSGGQQILVWDKGIFSDDDHVLSTKIFIETDATKIDSILQTYNSSNIAYYNVQDYDASDQQQEYYYPDGPYKRYFYKNFIDLYLKHTNGIYFYYKLNTSKYIFSYDQNYDYITINGSIDNYVLLQYKYPQLTGSDGTVSSSIVSFINWGTGDKHWDKTVELTFTPTTHKISTPWKLSLKYKDNNTWKTIPKSSEDRYLLDASLKPYSNFGHEIFYDYATKYDEIELYYTVTADISSCTDSGCWHSCGKSCTGQCIGSCTGNCGTSCGTACQNGCYTNCTSGCGGLCHTKCIGACDSSCTGGCSRTCTADCTKNCSKECMLICKYECSSSCNAYCEGECTENCTDECTRTCTGQCSAGCNKECVGGCEDSCDNNCAKNCGGKCTTGCTQYCTGGCQESCHGSCTYGCQGCTAECQGNAKNFKVI